MKQKKQNTTIRELTVNEIMLSYGGTVKEDVNVHDRGLITNPLTVAGIAGILSVVSIAFVKWAELTAAQATADAQIAVAKTNYLAKVLTPKQRNTTTSAGWCSCSCG